MSIHIKLLAATLAVVLSGSSAVYADTAIATKWRLLGQSQDNCVYQAAVAIVRIGFDKASSGSQTISGKKGDYTASIRCIAEQRMVFFVMSGPSAQTTSRYLDVLYGSF